MFLLKRCLVVGAISGLLTVSAVQRTTPPNGALSVRAGAAPGSGMFDSINGALAALPNDKSNQTIFIFPGVYLEQVNITRTGPLTIYGYTTDTTTFTSNQVVIQAGIPASTAGSDDASGTLRIHKNDFRLYNVNVTNTFGIGSQAIAISQYGSRVGLYASAFLGYQDTLYANQGTQVYLKSYIEGAVDFIFGRTGFAYFGGNTIATKAPGCITASGRISNDNGSCANSFYEACQEMQLQTLLARSSLVGRGENVTNKDFAKVIFKNTVITAPLNQTIWSIWNPGDERIDDILFAEYNSTGSGISSPKRPSFSTVLSKTQADAFSIASAVGSDYTSWVDLNYLSRAL
ncbi:carbohydrate esterase family 8 protein [Flammula alnicola]|nr:carbohydrate esterase family 8 protein [Flammula alnicola]